MTFDMLSAAFAADVEIAVEATIAPATAPRAEPSPMLPAHAEVADPEPGWATRNPDRARAFLFVSPRDCSAVDELLAL